MAASSAYWKISNFCEGQLLLVYVTAAWRRSECVPTYNKKSIFSYRNEIEIDFTIQYRSMTPA